MRGLQMTNLMNDKLMEAEARSTQWVKTPPLIIEYSPLSEGAVFQDAQWTPKTPDSTEPYVYYVLPICTYL